MQLKRLLVSAALGALLTTGLSVSAANAAVYRFTATSAASGLLGYMDFGSSAFDSSNSAQYVNNTSLLALDFTNPLNSNHVTAFGPPGDSTIFNSTGALPIVIGGSGFTGGANFSDGVWIAGTDYIFLAGDAFGDVSWTTSVAGVPEPAAWALMISGFGLAGAALRRRRLAVAA